MVWPVTGQPVYNPQQPVKGSGRSKLSPEVQKARLNTLMCKQSMKYAFKSKAMQNKLKSPSMMKSEPNEDAIFIFFNPVCLLEKDDKNEKKVRTATRTS